jgi:hypothetical protein
MKTIIHVDQHALRANRKGANLPPLTVKTYKSNRRCREVVLFESSGQETMRLVYRPEKPLPCGATVWIETKGEVRCAG